MWEFPQIRDPQTASMNCFVMDPTVLGLPNLQNCDCTCRYTRENKINQKHSQGFPLPGSAWRADHQRHECLAPEARVQCYQKEEEGPVNGTHTRLPQDWNRCNLCRSLSMGCKRLSKSHTFCHVQQLSKSISKPGVGHIILCDSRINIPRLRICSI